MDTTASSFTLRKNAKRAAEAMIRKGSAPAVDYDINPSVNGRFEIVWKIVKAAPTSDTNLGHCRADHPEHLDRDRAIGIDVVRAVEIDRIDVVARHKLLQVDNLFRHRAPSAPRR